jgi:adenine-specific DNA methylase
MDWSINQSIDRTIESWIEQSINQSTDRSNIRSSFQEKKNKKFDNLIESILKFAVFVIFELVGYPTEQEGLQQQQGSWEERIRRRRICFQELCSA